MMDYNENSFVSQLPQPSRFQSPGKLQEISASATNARSRSMLPPPGHLKRKTLVERAGETSRPAPAPPSSRPPVNATVRATSIAGATRQASFSSSVSSSSRAPSVASTRNVSSSSYSSSVGPGSRPPSTQSTRPHTAMAAPRIQKPMGYPGYRPSSTMETYMDPPSTANTASAREGMTPISLCPKEPSQTQHERSLRDVSLSTAMMMLSLDGQPGPTVNREASCTPSHLPRRVPSALICVASSEPQAPQSAPKAEVEAPNTSSHLPRHVPSVVLHPDHPSPSKSPRKTPRGIQFLTKDSNLTSSIAWDTSGRLDDMEKMYAELKSKMNDTTTESNSLKEMIGIYKARINELESMRARLSSSNDTLQADLDATKTRMNKSSIDLEDAIRRHRLEIDDIKHQNRREVDETNRNAEEECRDLVRKHFDEMTELRRRLEDALEEERSHRREDVQALKSEGVLSKQRVELELESKDRNLRTVTIEVDQLKANLLHEQTLNSDLQSKLSGTASNVLSLEATVKSLRNRIEFLESDSKSQSNAFADMEKRLQDAFQCAAEANDKLRVEEALRRKLHNQVQELKGNIRVFCRVRPSVNPEATSEHARITFPDKETDSREVEILGPEEKSSLGKVTTKTNAFAFDRVFTPSSQNSDVFNEISQLVQSALDGYNVCIFCYGQTGSGKTFTMSAEDGMIPQAVHQIYGTAKSLEDKGWKYSMQGSFVEVYNENLNDLLGKPEEFDKKKHEIRHDMQSCKTSITDVTIVDLDTPARVENILRRATSNRSVAATLANERSSRSHSVFILKLVGDNSITGEKSEGTLNLVDLAGSERLAQSGATGDRLKETQNINRSLSCLGDVIGALGQGKDGGHVPYRNSKLTYLLQFSLGGNSKTLMFVMVSPEKRHLSETLTSLKFATKVHHTHIGTARRQAKIRDS